MAASTQGARRCSSCCSSRQRGPRPDAVLPGQDLAESIIVELATNLLALDERVKRLDAQIAATFDQHPHAAVIQSMPGFGPFLGACLLVGAADLRALPSAGHLATVAGLVPVPNDSGRRTGNLHRPSATAVRCARSSTSQRKRA